MYIQEKGANRNICQQVCCITFGETSSGPVFGNEIEKKRFLDMLLNAIQDLKINVYAYCVLDYEAYILATAHQVHMMKMSSTGRYLGRTEFLCTGCNLSYNPYL